MTTNATLEKINLPFEGHKWVIKIHGDVFETYSTKKAALDDAKACDLKIVATNEPTAPRSN